MDSTAANAWIGLKLQLSEGKVEFEHGTCTRAQANATPMNIATLAADYRTTPDALGLNAEALLAVAVTCNNQPWTSPGAHYVTDGHKSYTVWDGVFFELAKR
jgi:hypothetical protein